MVATMAAMLGAMRQDSAEGRALAGLWASMASSNADGSGGGGGSGEGGVAVLQKAQQALFQGLQQLQQHSSAGDRDRMAPTGASASIGPLPPHQPQGSVGVEASAAAFALEAVGSPSAMVRNCSFDQ